MTRKPPAEAYWTCSLCGETGTVRKSSDAPKDAGTYAQAYPALLAMRAILAHNDEAHAAQSLNVSSGPSSTGPSGN
jgi:hypothetical protein